MPNSICILCFSGGASSRWMSSTAETDAEFDARYEAYFNRKDIDGWEIRKGMADLGAMDLVPEPTIVAAALRACRRVNDYALTTRILELVKFKAQHNPEIWPYMMQELKPTMDELGISSLEEIGYDKPELALPNPYEIHGEEDAEVKRRWGAGKKELKEIGSWWS